MSRRRLLVVGWDSADWKVIRPLMQRGEMPMMQRIVDQGVHGDLRTLEPSLSPMLWTTIATGVHPAEHGVHGFTEVRNDEIVPVSSATRLCKAVWNILSEHGLRTNLVGWFATQGERDSNVRLVSNLHSHLPRNASECPRDWPDPPPGTYWPAELTSMSSLRVSPVELGGEVLRMFVRDPEAIDQSGDRRLQFLAQKLAEAFSVQAATTRLMENEDWDLTMVYFRAIDEISHVFMPFHPPLLKGISEREFSHYHDVVNSTYRLHDLMLARLVDLAGPNAGVLVLSDHGFHSDHLRPRFVPDIPAGIVAWHRPLGIFAAAGNGFRNDRQSIFGAGLADITPTILSWFGLPRAKDMMGRVLSDSLASADHPEECETYTTPGFTSTNSASPEFAPDQRREMLRHFVDLGYISALPSDNQAAIAATRNENRWQLACSLMHSGRYEEALPLLEEAYDASPFRPDIAQRLTQCQLHFGLTERARKILEASVESFRNPHAVGLIRAALAHQMGDFQHALEYLQEIQKHFPDHHGLREQFAKTYVSLRRWDDAESTVREILAVDPGYSAGWAILSRCQLHRDENEACIESALEAIHLNFSSPLAHINLGLALLRTDRYSQAANAFRNAIQLAPLHHPPYRFLSVVYRRMGQHEASFEMLARAREVRQQAREQLALQRARVEQGVVKREAERSARQAQCGIRQFEPLELLIVSGLPRSGTSLMMQILQAGGIELLTDGKREADADNPEGYWEWEAIKDVERNPGILIEARGKAIKVISALLPVLPRIHRYRIIYMIRPIDQIVASQFTMLKRLGIESKQQAGEMAQAQEQHSRAIRAALKKSTQIELLEIDYTQLVADPIPMIESIAAFVGDRFKQGPGVNQCIKPSLHRQRQQADVLERVNDSCVPIPGD